MEPKKMDEEAKAGVEAWKYALGFNAMRVVKCVIDLGLPDVVERHGRPMKLSELSAAVGCPETSLYRIMRFLTHNGIFKRQISSISGSVHYAQTPLSRLLTRDKMGLLVLFQAGPATAQQLGITASDLKAGKGSGKAEATVAEDATWSPKIDEEYERLFREYLKCHAKFTISALIAQSAETFQGIGTMVDVGGNNGTAIGMLVKAFPWIRGINFDLDFVVSAASPVDGVEHVGGSMFEKVPKADAIMLMWILHDWSDELCVDILKKCKEAIPAETGKVIIVEAVIDEEEEDEYAGARLALDMTIMVATVCGKERTPEEWAALIQTAGFTKHTIKPMSGIESVIEAFP